jgi:hypothetical protein
VTGCSDGQIIHSSLEVDGTEISNGSRTVEYLRRGLGGLAWQVGGGAGGCDCSVQWRELGCDSPEECFVSPAADPAPWYDPAHPESGDFLGLLIPDMRPWFDGLAQRNVTSRISGLGGSSIGPMHMLERALLTQGVLTARNQPGLEWGRRWLTNTLAGLCDPCLLSVARLRSFCPPCDGSDDTAGEWYVYEVGLTQGPNDGIPPPVGGQIIGCQTYLPITLQLDAGIPFLYKLPDVCIEGSLNPENCGDDCLDFCHWLQDAPPAVQCSVEPPTLGDLASVITITAGNGLGDLTIEILTDCSPSAALAPLASLNVPNLPAGSVLVIDSALEQVRYTGPDDVTIDGVGFIALPFGQGMPWLAVGNCDPGKCISAQLSAICRSDCTATIQIATRLREG